MESERESDRFDRVAEVFERALGLRGEERAAYLGRSCDGDTALFREVESLLEEHERDGPSFESNLRGELVRAWEAETAGRRGALPERVGPFRIRSLLGRGGMGRVYLALQENPTREVALKVLHLDATDARARGRFELEGELLARLSHPGIAQIHEAGTAETERGLVPYFAMEYVRGQDLLSYAEARDLDQAERVELLARVADAVQHAHERGVVHRDLKPANVLVDEDGRPRVLDFGIARLTGEDVQRATLETLPGQILGTLRYMSPEQASGRPDEVDTRTDIYSLGVMLYELLARRPPYDVGDSSLPEALRTICEREPERLATLTGDNGGDLEVIVRKALEKEKARRYASAAELAEDLRRFVRHEPIHARPPSRFYVFRKLVRRNRTASVAAGLFLASVLGGLVTVSVLYFESEELRRAESYRRYVANLSALGPALENGRLRTAERLLAECPPEHRGWEWAHYELATHLAERTVVAHRRVRAAALSGDGRTLVTSDDDGEAAVWNAETGELLGRHPRADARRVEELVLDDAGSLLLARTPYSVDLVELGDLVEGEKRGERAALPLEPPGRRDQPRAVSLAPDGTLGYVARLTGGVEIWELPARRLASTSAYASVPEACIAAGDLLLTVQEQTLMAWDPGHEEEAWRVPALLADSGLVAACSGDGRLLAMGDRTGRVAIRDTATGEVLADFVAHDEGVTALALAGAETVVTASWSGILRVWNWRTAELRNTIAAHDGKVVAVLPTEEGKVISAGDDGLVRWWDLEARTTRRFPGVDVQNPGKVEAGLSDDGRWLVSLERGRGLVVRDGRTGRGEWTGYGGASMALLPISGELAVAQGSDVILVELATGRETRRLPLEGDVRALWTGDDGRALIARRDNHQERTYAPTPTNVEVFATDDLRRLGEWEDCGAGTLAADGRTLFLTGLEDGALLAVDLASGDERILRRGVNHHAAHGRLLAVSDVEGAIELWDTDELRWVSSLEGHPDRVVESLSFHPDGDRLASVAESDPTVRIWDVNTGALLIQLRLELEYGSSGRATWTRGLSSVAFSADGQRLVVGGMDGSTWIFDSRLDQARALWEGAGPR